MNDNACQNINVACGVFGAYMLGSYACGTLPSSIQAKDCMRPEISTVVRVKHSKFQEGSLLATQVQIV